MGLHVLAVPRPRHPINSGSGLGVDPLVRAPKPIDSDVVQERRELRILVAFSDLTYPRQRTVHASPALCPVRVLSPRVSFGRTPFLPTVRRSLQSFVPMVRRYYGSVRLLIVVHHGVTALALPTRLAGPYPASDDEISRFSRMELPRMHRVFDRAGPGAGLAIAPRPVLPSVPVTTSAPQKLDFAARCPGLRFPCQRFAPRPGGRAVCPRGRERMTRGHDGSLLLSCIELSSTTPCRFIPAHYWSSDFRTPTCVPESP